MSIRLCIGEYAKTGFEPEYMGMKIYSLEELCWFIKENAWLLDDTFRTEELGEWLSEECALPELGEELKKACRKKISLRAFVGMILEYACFFPKEINAEIETAIAENSKLTVYEKKKAKADALVRKGHYRLAGKEYSTLLNMIPEEQVSARGEVYHGCGVCLAKMFYFSLAEEYFRKAHTMTGKIASYKQYLWTKRLSMTEKEYVAFLKEHEEAYEDSLDMEEMLEDLQKQWEESAEARSLRELRKQRQNGNVAEYQRQLTLRTEELKDIYKALIE